MDVSLLISASCAKKFIKVELLMKSIFSFKKNLEYFASGNGIALHCALHRYTVTVVCQASVAVFYT